MLVLFLFVVVCFVGLCWFFACCCLWFVVDLCCLLICLFVVFCLFVDLFVCRFFDCLFVCLFVVFCFVFFVCLLFVDFRSDANKRCCTSHVTNFMDSTVAFYFNGF